MAHESWTDWFTQQVKVELRDKITNFEDVWSLMFLSSDKQEILDTAARVAEQAILERDREIVRQDICIYNMQAKIDYLEKLLEHEQMENFGEKVES